MSHASEDKARFVVPFATALRARGLDVWLDEWEMLPGDSLVTKIFTEGIDQAAAVVVILSATSVTKRWVVEELDAAVVKRIQEETLLVPVVLDDLAPNDVPSAIRHLIFEPVPDVTDFGAAVDRVVRSVLNERQKPALGTLPAFATSDSDRERVIDGLDTVDSSLLRLAGEEAVRDFGRLFRTHEFLESTTSELQISEAQFVESLEVLDADGYITIHRTLGSGIQSMSSFELTMAGLDMYASTFVPDYGEIQQRVISQLVSGPEQGTEEDIADRVQAPRLLVLHIMELLQMRRLVALSDSLGPTTHYFNVSPKLRRLLS